MNSSILSIVSPLLAGVLGGVMWDPIGQLGLAFAALADKVVALLPDAVDLELEVPSGWLHGYAMLNTFLPLAEALTFATLVGGVVVAALLARLAVTIYHLIPKPGMGT